MRFEPGTRGGSSHHRQACGSKTDEIADLVTEMREVKHYYTQGSWPAGIEM